MNLAKVEAIVDAVLYEGYMLYPYRPTSVKNRQRWTFGGLFPRAYSEAQASSDAWSTQTECLVRAQGSPVVDVKIRFLHLLSRNVRALAPSAAPSAAAASAQPSPSAASGAASPPEETLSWAVASLRVGGRLVQTWQEAEEREVDVADLDLTELTQQPREVAFACPSWRTSELLIGPDGARIGVVVREQQAIRGRVVASAEPLEDRLFRLTVRIENLTEWEAERSRIAAASIGTGSSVADPSTNGFAGTDPQTGPSSESRDHSSESRDRAAAQALNSTHTILGVREGEFVSLLDPPSLWRKHAAACSNVGSWPVMVGDEDERQLMLSSPIILYDYPQVAPESPGTLFDSTEIDEILTLRILTLTEDEQVEMGAVDEYARDLLERTQALTPEQLKRMHGAMRTIEARTSEVYGE